MVLQPILKIWKRLYNIPFRVIYMITYLHLVELGVSPENCLVLFEEPVMNPQRIAEKMLELLITKFNVKAVFPACSGVMSWLPYGRGVSLLVEIGHGATQIIPIFQSNQHVVVTAKFPSCFVRNMKEIWQ